MKIRSLSFFLIASFVIYFAVPSFGQVRPVNDYGAMGLAQLLKRLQTTGSVMMVGAHPDDEDSALLAYLARGRTSSGPNFLRHLASFAQRSCSRRGVLTALSNISRVHMTTDFQKH